MTRSDAKALDFTQRMPKKNAEGLFLKYEEVFISGGGQDTEEDARISLQKIIDDHPKSRGWESAGGINEGVFKDFDGRWYAYRHHGRYVLLEDL